MVEKQKVWNRLIWRDVSGAGGELQLRDIRLESYVRVDRQTKGSRSGSGSGSGSGSSIAAAASAGGAPDNYPASSSSSLPEEGDAITASSSSSSRGASYLSAPPAPAAPRKALADLQIEEAMAASAFGDLGAPSSSSTFLPLSSSPPPLFDDGGARAAPPGGGGLGDDPTQLGFIVVVFMAAMVALAVGSPSIHSLIRFFIREG